MKENISLLNNKFQVNDIRENKELFDKTISLIFEKKFDLFFQNFQNLLKCIKNEILQKNENGFNIFHLLITYSDFKTVKQFIEENDIFKNEKSQFGQSNLLIALNQSSFKVIKYMFELSKESPDTIDNFNFNRYLYMARNNSIQLFFYFNCYDTKWSELDTNNSINNNFNMINNPLEICDNVNIYHKDSNGCSMLHWTAYQNGEFLFKLLHRLGLDVTLHDFKNLTPFERASENNGFKVINYLLSMSRRPILTNYFLYGNTSPVYFDFIPNNLTFVNGNYESEYLKIFDANCKYNINSFLFKFKNTWTILNIKIKIGALIYFLYFTYLIYYTYHNQNIFNKFSNSIITTILIFLITLNLVFLWFSN